MATEKRTIPATNNRRLGLNRQRYASGRCPNFESGLIAEPLLAFGGRNIHCDPKTGLGLYGPYSMQGQSHPPLTSITIGIVGPAPMVADAERWLDACRGVLANDGKQPFLYPHFPGINSAHPFQCELISGDTWREAIPARDLENALGIPGFSQRIKKVVGLYLRAIETLAQREPRPGVVLCCIPQVVIDICTVRTGNLGEAKRIRLSRAERILKASVSTGQLLLPGMDLALGIEGEEGGHHNLRRGLKAESMQYGVPTQIVWPRTILCAEADRAAEATASQDIATRAWNFATALYHKAGGSPWRLADVDPGVCFVGLSFYRDVGHQNPNIRTSMAQAFTSAGDGYVLRGNSFAWNEAEQGKSPHLTEQAAAAMMRDVLDLYQRQNRGALPNRVVVHKTSRYWTEELRGFQEACELVPQKDFVALGWRGVQFYRPGDYPALRGTYVKFGATDLLLYTVGYVPFLRTYPGARVPQPIEVVEHHGDSPWDVVLREILGLTKLNWNTADFACSAPVTIAFSRRVGQILAELPADLPLRSEYRFYM
jgi:hypothetical protein